MSIPKCECGWEGSYYELENSHKCPECGKKVD